MAEISSSRALELEEETRRDAMTGVHNRAYLAAFGAINDRFGHQAGDRILQATARSICERIVTAFQNTGHVIGSDNAHVTVSVGCVTHGSQISFANVAEFVKAADQALYTAKLRGRNRTVPYDKQLPSVLANAAPRSAST